MSCYFSLHILYDSLSHIAIVHSSHEVSVAQLERICGSSDVREGGRKTEIEPVPTQSVLLTARCSADPTDARGLSQLDCPALAGVSSQLRERERERE